MSVLDGITNEFLQDYLRYTEHTEPPKMMHVWAALSGVSACLGRRCWIETGIGSIYPNLYVLLVGPPGTRKTTAMNNVKKLVEKNTQVRFAPKDTAGQRQGLITAMQGEKEEELEDGLLDVASAIASISEHKMSICAADRHAMYVCAAEFRSFMGQNNLDLTGFLLEMWDGEDYDYQLKTAKIKLKDPLLNLIGCTTPTEISVLLPPQVIGQGFMSRFILVYAADKYKKIPPSRAYLDKEVIPCLADVFSFASNKMNGPMKLSESAKRMDDKLYMREVSIQDTRFMYYIERRHTHLMKVACALAASRKSMTIEADDLEQADLLLSHTELSMPDALGEFGLSPIATAKQKMAEYIQHANGPITSRILWMVMQRDIKLVDFRNALSDMVNAGKILSVKTTNGDAFVYVDSAHGMLEGLIETKEETGT